MKIEIEDGSQKVSIEVDVESLDAVTQVKTAAEGLMSSLRQRTATPPLPFGFSLASDTERLPEEVFPDAEFE